MDLNSDDIIRGEISYTHSERAIRDQFVQEYLRDYNSYAACVRLGYMDELALNFAKQLMQEPYVLRGIADAEAQRSNHLKSQQEKDLSHLPAGFIPHDEETDKQRIVSGLFREAFYKGPGATHSSRVSALTTLAKIYKLDKADEVEEDAETTNVMVVPAVGSLNDWESAATEQQERLKKTVKE